MADAMHEPLSWLTLERYALDELSPEERARVAARLAVSSADRACLEEILGDRSALPPLPALLPKRRRPWLRLGGALAMAAAVLVVVLREGAIPSRRVVHDGVKGGEVALVVRGEHSTDGTFAQGERFKLLVTCPNWLSTQLRVHVFQGGEHFAPLTHVPVFACGNGVPWPGAFALDGDAPAQVCVSFGGSGQPVEPKTARELEPSVVCETLTPR